MASVLDQNSPKNEHWQSISVQNLARGNLVQTWFLLHKEWMPAQQNFQMRSFANVAHCQ